MSAHLSGRHSTMTPATTKIWKFVRDLPGVVKCGPGVIAPSGPGPMGVKIMDESGAILLIVRGGTAVQEFRVYTNNRQETKLALARFVREAGWRLSFT